MTEFLLGAIAMGCATAALLFLRFWRSTGDRLFFYFALSFVVEAANRAIFALNGARSEDATLYYLIRLGAYLLILWAIVEKNLPRRSGG
jgi:hypothetical protein